MDLPEYLRLVATKLEASDRDETLRLIQLLLDVLSDAQKKIVQP